MKTIAQALKFIEESNGEEFSVRFIKRGTFEPREMNCRIGKVEDLKGGKRAYDPMEHHVVNVFEIGKGFRCFPLDGWKAIKIGEVWHTIVTPDVLHQQLLDDEMDQELASG